MFELNDSQLKQLADFSSNLSLLLFGASLITPFFTNIDELNQYFVAGGLLLAIAFLIISMIILKGVKKDD